MHLVQTEPEKQVVFALHANRHFMSHSATPSGLMLKLPPDIFPSYNALETSSEKRNKLTNFQRKTMRAISSLRYRANIYKYPYELKVLQKFWLRYRQPEIQGF